MLVGVLVTLAAALLPALRAARLSPMAALRSDVTISTGSSRRRFVIGTIVTLVGAAGVGLALTGDDAQQVFALLGAGVLILFVGFAMLAPLIARPLSRILGWPAARLAGVAGKLGRENAMRNPQRTAQTATALTIGLALVTFVTVFASSFSTSIGQDIDRQLKADLVVYDESSFLGFPLTAEQQVAKQPLVQTVAAARGGTVRAGGSERSLVGVDPAAIAQSYDPEFTSGGWGDLTNGGVAVSKDTADDLDVTVGDRLPVQFAGAGTRDLTVEAIYKDSQVRLPRHHPPRLRAPLPRAARPDHVRQRQGRRRSARAPAAGAGGPHELSQPDRPEPGRVQAVRARTR